MAELTKREELRRLRDWGVTGSELSSAEFLSSGALIGGTNVSNLSTLQPYKLSASRTRFVRL